MKVQGDAMLSGHSSEGMAMQQFLSESPKPQSCKSSRARSLPKISIVMPSYNQVRYLERSIRSVLNQNYPNLEFIIIDGGSTDGSLEIIKKYEPHVAYWHSGPDSGQSDALNHGFSKATGDIYGWLNSDDLYLPGAFEYAAEAFCLHFRASVFFGDWWQIDSEDNVTSVQHAFDFSLGHFIYEGFHLNSQGMFWRREAHERFGEFDVNLHRTMDYDLILRLGLVEGQNAFYRIPYPLACFRRHEAQKTLGFDSIVQKEHVQIALKNRLDKKYTSFGNILRLMYRFRRAYWYVKRDGVDNLIARSFDWRKRVKNIIRICKN